MLSENRLPQVWDWNATTPDVLLGSATLDLRALSATRSEVEQEREEAAFQVRVCIAGSLQRCSLYACSLSYALTCHV